MSLIFIKFIFKFLSCGTYPSEECNLFLLYTSSIEYGIEAISAGAGMSSFRDYELEYPGYKENNKDEIEILQESRGDDTKEIEINI